MRKTKLFTISLVILPVLIGITAVGIATAKEQPEGTPFKALWNAVNNIQSELRDLSGRILALENWKTIIDSWKTEIENWRVAIRDLSGRILALENWKTIIDSWKTEIENWRIVIKEWQDRVNEKLATIQEEIVGLGDRISILETPATLLEKIKTVDGSGSGLDADLLDGYESSEFLSVPWSRLTSFPADCPTGQYVYGLGGVLKCSAPTAGISGSGIDNYIPKWLGTNSLENSVIYQTDVGNVGIGTTAPGAPLEIYRASAGTSLLRLESGHPFDLYRLDVVPTIPVAGDINWEFRLTDWGGGLTDQTVLTLVGQTGNVGIGTTAPTYKLDVAGTIRAGDIFAAGGRNLIVGDDTYLTDIDVVNMLGIYGIPNSDRAGIRLGSDGSYIFGDNGNIGIGTTGPTERLHIVNNADGGFLMAGTRPRLKLQDTGGTLFAIEATGNRLEFCRFGVGCDLTITTGNVGIGTMSPGAKLDVAGKIKSQNAKVEVSSSLAASTTSTTWVDMPDMNVTVTTGNSPLQILFVTSNSHQLNDGCYNWYQLLLDGSPIGYANHHYITSHQTVSILRMPTVSAGSHTIKVQWKVSCGKASSPLEDNSGTRTLTVIEL